MRHRQRPLVRLLTAAAAAAALLATAACGSGGGAGGGTTAKVGYFEGAVAGPEAVIAGNKSLAGKVDAHLKLVPVDSGVAGLAQLRGGAFPIISGVGNPPFVGAVGSGTSVETVYVESQDQAGLVVDSSIKGTQGLVGQQVGVLVGSTLDFELRGWLKTQHLTGKVKVTSFASEAAAAAAWKSHRLHAVYISEAQLLNLTGAGGKVLVTSTEIAKLGYSAVNLLAVTPQFAKAHHQVVQQLVCQVVKAQADALGPDAAKYITPAAGYLGVPAKEAIEGTKGYPYIPASQELSWFKGPDGTLASGKLVKDFQLTGTFLVGQGRLDKQPTTAQLTSHIDPSYAEKALSGHGCS
jgi:NitT/TauT family transport system substrate-binding protein